MWALFYNDPPVYFLLSLEDSVGFYFQPQPKQGLELE